MYSEGGSLHRILRRGCKAIGPGVLVSISIQLLFLVTLLASHPTGGFSHRDKKIKQKKKHSSLVLGPTECLGTGLGMRL